MGVKEYELPNGRKAVFEFDVNRVGKITLEAMDMLMEMIGERKEGEWIDAGMDGEKCSRCGWSIDDTFYSSQFLYCPNCGARMKGE